MFQQYWFRQLWFRRLWLIGATSLISSLSFTGLVTLAQIFSQKNMTSSAQAEPTTYPTALPWVEAESDCVGKTRHWKDNLCFESAHDSMF